MEQDDKEKARLTALAKYDILDTSKEEAFDRIIRLTCRIFDVPGAAVSLIDEKRQWFKSCSHEEIPSELPRQPALCNLAIQQATTLIVPDTHVDARFADNMFVVGEPRIRFMQARSS